MKPLGFSPVSPPERSARLTPEKQKYDDACRAIKALEVELGNLSAALFTAAELVAFSSCLNNPHFNPTQGELDQQLNRLLALKIIIDRRKG